MNFPEFQFTIRQHGQKKVIFDEVRKKFIPLTPEEWVRQHAIQLLNQYLNIPFSRMSVERELQFHTLKKRFDLVVYDIKAQPMCICEFKAPDIVLGSEVLLQTGIYDSQLGCRFIWITNGVVHHWFERTDTALKPIRFPETLD